MYEELSELKSEIDKTKKENNYLRKEVDNAKSIAEEYRKQAESYQKQCIEINNLNVALDIMCRKYTNLRKTVGMDL